MKKFNILAFLFVANLSGSAIVNAQEKLVKPYFLGTRQTGDVSAVLNNAKTKLEGAGFETAAFIHLILPQRYWW